jgi:hypothetical protein
MWDRNTPWFDLAVILGVFAIGNVLFGRFVVHQNRGRRVLKVVLFSAFYVWLAQGLGRTWAYGFLGLALLAFLVIHGWWLPKNGINGWTAEPYEKYLELVTRRRPSASDDS